ncbi:hypothetical protein [Sphingobacterium sp. UDSM-2020]|uniref:hypothetical protein n=1 Tax=Sphingobacterium sp. UDSM-2020 TaxID=2795738 RepID=UPI001938BE89|nr:hypothetical protein [Sphingobacterium sp. UDSM-2020]QQD16044.1 hypothetical protein JAZ75_11210 [Sphingobacterium sp. UDSM-2020]
MPWYQYTPFGFGDVCNPNNYTLVGSTPPSCIGFDQLCAIQAPDIGGIPFITQLLQCEIANALSNHFSSANVILKF